MASDASIENPTTATALRRFALAVAGPRDLLINLLVNGFIAWLVFGQREAVPLAGAGSIFEMLVPMSLIEATLTTFFGWLNGWNWYRKHVPLAEVSKRRILLRAAVSSVLCGLASVAAMIAVMLLFRWWQLSFQLSPLTTIGCIAAISGAIAYGLHSRAVLKAAAECDRGALS